MIGDDHIGFLRLVLRSPDRGDGWRSVSGALRKLVLDMVEGQPDLFEIKEDGDKLMLRLSEKGEVLGMYL